MKDLLEDLEMLFLLSFIDAPPSYVMTWLKNRGIGYKFSSERIEERIREDERTGTKEGIRSVLEETIKSLEFKLETFSNRVDNISEVYTITLLIAPVMLYAVGLFQPETVKVSLWVLLLLNGLLLVLFRDLHPRVFKLKTNSSSILGSIALSVVLSFIFLKIENLRVSLVAQILTSLPFAVSALRRWRRMESELRENHTILLKALTEPFHLFRAVPPGLLTAETYFGISRSLRLTLYLSSFWGIEEKSALLFTYEKIYNFYKKTTRKGFLNAAMNLLTIFLLGFASAIVKNILKTLPLDAMQQWVTIGDKSELFWTIDVYVMLASILYALGLSIISLGSLEMAPFWIPLVSTALLLGEVLGERLLVYG
ncbi:MAG: hypothetical protein ACP5II_07655 [Infirmifilum sp.]|jgi:hypothetical protein|uniref:hypothetical protein n=1 Tax=Infirmifilum TaxID=2856573 RepID=UPI002356E8DE